MNLEKPEIYNIVSSFVSLRKTGKNYSGLCPFHNEKTPSFIVNPDWQHWHCFGCATGGDVIDFIQKLHRTDFKGALSILGVSDDRSYKPDPVLVRKRELERQGIRQQREVEQRRVHAECQRLSIDLFNKAGAVDTTHPYLVKKGIQAFRIKQLGEMLLIPVEDWDGTLYGLQFIMPDGTKNFKKGTAKAGHFCRIGTSINNMVIICEGYATGVSLHEATGHTVIVAFDAGNLLSVAKGIRSKHPDIKIVIAADNDQWPGGKDDK